MLDTLCFLLKIDSWSAKSEIYAILSKFAMWNKNYEIQSLIIKHEIVDVILFDLKSNA